MRQGGFGYGAFEESCAERNVLRDDVHRSWVKRTWPGTLLWTWLASQSKAKVVLPERPGAVKNVMINSITKCESHIICKQSSSQYMFEESLSYIHSFAFLPFAS